jgi:hypothetical protein
MTLSGIGSACLFQIPSIAAEMSSDTIPEPGAEHCYLQRFC